MAAAKLNHMCTINTNVVWDCSYENFSMQKIGHAKVSWHENFQIYRTCYKSVYINIVYVLSDISDFLCPILRTWSSLLGTTPLSEMKSCLRQSVMLVCLACSALRLWLGRLHTASMPTLTMLKVRVSVVASSYFKGGGGLKIKAFLWFKTEVRKGGGRPPFHPLATTLRVPKVH